MLAAEQWYQQQEKYHRYGVEMQPERQRQRGRRVKQEPKKVSIAGKDKLRLFALVILMGVVCAAIIITSAYGASIKYQTNQIIKENHVIQSDIENLTVQVYTSNSIEAIESKATGKLGMVYPKSSQVVYLAGREAPPSDMAQRMKNQAYN